MRNCVVRNKKRGEDRGAFRGRSGGVNEPVLPTVFTVFCPYNEDAKRMGVKHGCAASDNATWILCLSNFDYLNCSTLTSAVYVK